MTDIKEECSACTKDKKTKFCSQCGRNTRCPGCDTFVDFNCQFCPNCGHQLRQAPEKSSTVDKSVNVGYAVGSVATGDYHEGAMTAYVNNPNQEGLKDLKRLDPGAIPKSAVDRSVNVGGSVGLVSTGDHHKGDMTTYVGPPAQGDDSPSIKQRELLGFARKQTSKSEMRKAIDDSTDIEFHDLAKKVGCVWSPVCIGTAFRVGKDLIMTCWHVISGIISDMRDKHGIENIYPCENVWVQFDYKPGEESYNSGNRFLFHCLLYHNPELDYAVVRLDDPNGKLPPPVTRFCHPGVNDTLHLIGHSQALQKKLDPDCVMDNPTTGVVANCEGELKTYLGREWSTYEGDCYQGLEKDRRFRFHSAFVQGASGSPGAVRISGGLAVVTMLARGYPGFYFSLSKEDQNRLDLPNGFFIEEGVDIMAILDDIKKNRPDIFDLLDITC